MSAFTYRGVTASGKRLRANDEAPNAEALVRTLGARGITVLEVHAVEPAASGRARVAGRGSRVALLEVTRTVAALLPAGMPLASALHAATNVASPGIRDTMLDVRTRVERGDSLATALAEHPHVFPPLYIGLVRAGERSGSLSASFARLTEQLERDEALRAKILSASIYPLLLGGAGTISIAVLLLFVLPRFAELLSGAGAALPSSTAALLALSAWARRFWPALVVLPVTLAFLVAWARTSDRGRAVVSRSLLALPIVGALRAQVLSARFARLTGVLLAGGAPLLAALDNAIESIGDPVARDEASRIRTRVREGVPLAGAIGEGTLFPPLLAQLVAVGEDSGRLQEFLLKASDIFETQSDRTRQRLVTLVEPAMIVLFGGGIGFVALSLLQAVYGINAGAFR
ncbi:MAG: type II secretion system F family protein [Gemmatimonadaceae bacterium]|nr:type II secretion system F family protein [Gemmatimonadaceae bacterium]